MIVMPLALLQAAPCVCVCVCAASPIAAHVPSTTYSVQYQRPVYLYHCTHKLQVYRVPKLRSCAVYGEFTVCSHPREPAAHLCGPDLHVRSNDPHLSTFERDGDLPFA